MSYRSLFVALTVVLGVAPLQAQHLLFAKSGDAMHVVKRVVQQTPYVDDGTGKLVPAERTYAFRAAPEFLPAFVTVHNLNVRYQALQVDGGNQINREFRFDASFESAYPLDDVFVVLDLNSEHIGKAIFLHEIGRMAPHEPTRLDLAFPITENFGAGKFQLHIYANGAELLHSKMSPEAVERALNKSVRHRIEGVQNAAAQPFIGPDPEYPAQLQKKKLNGSALLAFTITPHGQIFDPVVKSATDPAFGQAALVAIRQWRFLPKVVNGQPVESHAEMPFEFKAGDAVAK